MNVWKPLEVALTGGARMAWPVFQAINRRVAARTFQPRWSAQPLMASRQRSRPQLGWPRETDSLCPVCVRDARSRILAGERSVETLVNEHAGEIKDHGRHRRTRYG